MAKTFKFYPAVVRALVRKHGLKVISPLRILIAAKHYDNGSGIVPVTRFVEWFHELAGVHPWDINKTIARGEELGLWKTWTHPKRGKVMQLAGWPSLAASLGLENIGMVAQFEDTGYLKDVKKLRALVTEGAFIAERTKKGLGNRPISRQSIQQECGISGPTQKRYEDELGIERKSNVGVVSKTGTPDPEKGQFRAADGTVLQKLPSSYQGTVEGLDLSYIGCKGRNKRLHDKLKRMAAEQAKQKSLRDKDDSPGDDNQSPPPGGLEGDGSPRAVADDGEPDPAALDPPPQSDQGENAAASHLAVADDGEQGPQLRQRFYFDRTVSEEDKIALRATMRRLAREGQGQVQGWVLMVHKTNKEVLLRIIENLSLLRAEQDVVPVEHVKKAVDYAFDKAKSYWACFTLNAEHMVASLDPGLPKEVIEFVKGEAEEVGWTVSLA